MLYKILKSEYQDFLDYLKDTSIKSFTENSILTLDNNEYIFEDISQFNELKNPKKKDNSQLNDTTMYNKCQLNDTTDITTSIDKDLIYGKDPTERIVNISIDDNLVYIYRELEDGTIDTQVKQANYWIIGASKPAGKYITLEGSQPYKYLKEYSDYEDYKVARINCYKKKSDVYSISNLVESYMVRNGYTYFKGMKISEVSVLSFDIETTGLDPKLDDARVLLISNTYRNNKGVITRKLFSLDDYENDAEMIEDWCSWVRKMNASILLGHNIFSFDLPYLNHRGGGLELGRDDSYLTFEERPSNLRVDGSQQYTYFKVHIQGRELLDTWFLSIKYDIQRKYPNYKLKDIIEFERLTQKDRQFYDASKIKDNWHLPEERVKIKAYCISDSDDSLKLFDLMGPSFFYFTIHCPKPFQLMLESASGSQINSMMVRSYLQINKSLPKTTELSPVQGAISFGLPKFRCNVLKLDFSGLYPSIIRTWQLYDPIKDPNRNFLKLTDYFAEERLKHKKIAKDTDDKYYKDLEQMEKQTANSMYGMLNCQGLLFNNSLIAGEITRNARELLNKITLFFTSIDINKWKEKLDTESEEVENE